MQKKTFSNTTDPEEFLNKPFNNYNQYSDSKNVDQDIPFFSYNRKCFEESYYEESHLNSIRTQPSSTNISPNIGDIEPEDENNFDSLQRKLEFIYQPLNSRKSSKKSSSYSNNSYSEENKTESSNDFSIETDEESKKRKDKE